jgi:hypothetical protein
MKVTHEKALANAISMIELVDITSGWYEEAAESTQVLRKMLESIRRRKRHE